MRGMTLDQLGTIYYPYTDVVPSAWLLPQRLPGLRAFWANSFDLSKAQTWYDQSGAAVPNNLTGVGASAIGCATTWPGALAPYIELDGTNDYFTIDDNASLSITGDLTMLMWLYPDSASVKHIQGLVNKWLTTGDARGYTLYLDTGMKFVFGISSDGTAANSQTAETR